MLHPFGRRLEKPISEKGDKTKKLITNNQTIKYTYKNIKISS
jgi:hypothetical protein